MSNSSKLFCIKVSRRGAEVGVGPVSIDAHFAKSVTYLPWMYSHEFVIFSARPQEVPDIFSLIRPFPPIVWLSIVGTKLTLRMISHIFSKFNHINLRDSIRITISMSLFAGFMFSRLYSETFESSLVAKEFEQPINTIQDVMDSEIIMYYPEKTALGNFIVGHPSKEMKQLVKDQTKTFPFVGAIPSWVKNMSVCVLKIL